MFQKEHKYTARLLCGAAAGALVMFANIAHAEDLSSIDIASQPLAKALGEFASQTKRAVLVTPELTASRVSHSVSGATDPESALLAMLDGTGLTYRRDGDTFLIVRASDPQSGSAAGDGADAGTVQALIVTAQKREEDIQDVPIAISAFTQEDLTRSQVAGGPDLVTQVPNFTFTKTNFSSYSIQLRGIGTQAISATTDPAVAVAFNNTPFLRNRFFEQEFYDLQRVEVLRGPQGTLYGRNATAGVVNIISAKPKFTAEARLSADIGNYSSSRIEGMINIPLVEDKVALRLAGAWTKRDGYATNQITGNPIDGRDLWSTRLSLRFAPTDHFDANLIWEHFEENDDRLRSGKQLCKKDVVTELAGLPVGDTLPTSAQGGTLDGPQGSFNQGCVRTSLYSPDAFQTPQGAMLPFYLPLSYIGLPTAHETPYVSQVQSQDLRVIESTIDPDYRAKADIGELQISFDLNGALTLSSETAYGADFVFSLQDFNRFNTAPGAWQQPRTQGFGHDRVGALLEGPNGGIFCDPQLGCSDRLIVVDLSTAEARQFTQEFRLASNYEGAFNFSLGANFMRADSMDKYYVFSNSFTLFAADGNFSLNDQLPPYISNQTDDMFCLASGAKPGCADDEGCHGGDGPTYFADLAPGGVFCDPQLGCSNTLAGFDISQAKGRQFTQELRVQSDFEGPFNFSAGANYTRFQTLIDYYVFYNLITAVAMVGPFGDAAADTGTSVPLCWRGVIDGFIRGPVSADDPTATCPYIDPNPIESINGEGHNYFRSKNPYKLKSWAAFAEGYWQATDTLKVTAGLRYTDDRKSFIPVPSQVLLAAGPLAGGTVNRGYPEKDPINQHWGEWSGRLGVDWKPDLSFTDATMLYAFYSRGYKGGGANPPQPGFATKEETLQWFADAGANPFYALLFNSYLPVLKLTSAEYGPTFKPEFVNAYEIGAKNTLIGGALTLNADAFFYDYTDYQVSQIRDRTAVNENFDATLWGLEFQSVFAPSRDFQVIANFGYLDTKIAAGEKSIDIMNRTQGNPNYILVKPWAQLPSNCVVPTPVAELWAQTRVTIAGTPGICGGLGGFLAVLGASIIPTDPNPAFGGGTQPYDQANYPELNGGAGLFADLGGKELPNSPHWTANLGAQYGHEILDGSWRASVRADAYWQSQSWARVYNAVNDKLHGWYNVNLSVWLEKPDQDLKIEFYAKNLLDKTPITDAFLNSDDTALTTNVFVLDPRLIGLSIKKGF